MARLVFQCATCSICGRTRWGYGEQKRESERASEMEVESGDCHFQCVFSKMFCCCCSLVFPLPGSSQLLQLQQQQQEQQQQQLATCNTNNLQPATTKGALNSTQSFSNSLTAVDGASCSSNSSNNNNIIGSLRLQFQPSFDLCYVVDTHIREPEAAAANADTDTFLLTICRRRHLSHLCPSSTPPLPKSTLRIVHLTKKKFAKKTIHTVGLQLSDTF